MRQLKSRRFLRVLAEYLKNDSTNFNETYVILRQSTTEVVEFNRLKTGHSLFHGNQFMGEFLAKNHDLREESGISLRLRTDTGLF